MVAQKISKLGYGLVKVMGIFLLLFSAISIIQGIYSLQVSFNQGRFGFEYDISNQDHATILRLNPGFPAEMAGMKPGDQIHKVDGVRVKGGNLNALFGKAVAGTKIMLTIKRDGKLMELTMTRRLLPVIERLLNVLYRVIFPFLMLAYVAVGLWGIYRHTSYITGLIALVCFSFGAILSVIGGRNLEVITPISEFFHYYQIQPLLSALGSAMAPACWLFLFVNFPRKIKFYLEHKQLTRSLIFFFPWASIAAFYLLPAGAKYYLQIFFFVYSAVYITLGIIILSRGSVKEENILKQRQYKLTLFGTKIGALAIGVGFGILLIYQLLLRSWPPYFGWLTFFLFLVCQIVGLLLPLTFLNSFMRNKLLETEGSLRRRLRFVAASFVLFALYLAAAFVFSNWLINLFNVTEPALIVFTVLLLSITFSPLHARLMRWLEQRLYPEKTRYKSALKEMTKRMSGYIEESEILDSLANWLSNTMGISPIHAVSIDLAGSGSLGMPLNRNSPGSVLARVRDGSNFYWDEITEENSLGIDEEEKKWARQKGISISVPMISSGDPVGLLSIGKKKNAEDFTGDDLEIFQEAAFHTAVALQNIKHQMERLQKKRLEKEMEVAQEIQKCLVPSKLPDIDGLILHGHYQPCMEVGGDYYDVIALDEHRTALVIADVSGKGAGAALLMSNLQASIRIALSFDLPFFDVVYKINNLIYENSLQTQFITFFIGIWDNRDDGFQYINAGHNHPILLKANGKVKFLKTTGIGLGIKPNQNYKIKKVSFLQDDVLVIYTDGIDEFFNSELEVFGTARMLESFKESRHLEPKEIVTHLFAGIHEFAGCQDCLQSDDMTILITRRTTRRLDPVVEPGSFGI